MKIAMVADVHLWSHPQGCTRQDPGPLNERAQAIASTLNDAHDHAANEGADAFIVLGDLFDRPNPSPPMVAAAQAALTGSSNRRRLRTFILMGNHDLASTAEGHHALGPLDGYQEIQVVAEPKVALLSDEQAGPGHAVALCFMPYRPEPVETWLEETLAQLDEIIEVQLTAGVLVHKVLFLHAGLRAGDEPEWLQGGHDAVDIGLLQRAALARGYKAIAAGNWHTMRAFGAPIPALQVGALVPTGWDNPGLKGLGRLAFYDTVNEGFGVIEMPGPRFLNWTPAEARQALKTQFPHPGLGQYRVRIKTSTSDPQLVNDVKALGYGYVAEVLNDDSVKQAGQVAARDARDAATVELAVAAFVAEMHLLPPADVATVLDWTHRYLNGQSP